MWYSLHCKPFGIACIANLLGKKYLDVNKDFETNFYKIDRGVKTADMVRFLKFYGLNYKTKFIDPKKLSKNESLNISKSTGSITLIRKNKKYPIGYYLLRVENGWVDPWIDLPSINNVKAGVRKELPNDPWYAILREK